MLRTLAICLCLALLAVPESLWPAWAGETLSGVYHGSITVRPKDAVVPYDDRNATIKIVDQSGEPVAVVTYSAHIGRWREVCTITYNPDDTVTLTGTSYTVLSGSDSFSPDTFIIRIAPDGSLSGGSIDSEGGTTVLAMHH